MLLSVSGISKAFGDNQVLNDVSFAVHAGQRVGLVGANGVGKSTLLKIITGELPPDGGQVQIAPRVELGYLPQVMRAAGAQTVDELVQASQGKLQRIKTRLRTLEEMMAASADDLDEIMIEYSALTEQFERRGGYEMAYRADQIFAGLDIAHLPRTRRVDTLSGGEKSRVGLAALLLSAPDLLLLDEPTNHLDFRALEWLEEYLIGYRGGVLLVSHDRNLLNKTADALVEIVEHSREAQTYSGNYDFFAQIKAQERVKWEEAYARQQEEIAALRKALKSKARFVAHNHNKDGDKMLYDFKAGRIDGAISRKVRAVEERLRRVEEDPVPRPPRQLAINPEFDPQSLNGRTPLSVSMLDKAYGTQVLLDDVTFALEPHSRVVIVGPNGAGKSTLLKIAMGLVAADGGHVAVSPSVRLGFLDQEQELLAQTDILFDAYRDVRRETLGLADFEEVKAELLSTHLFHWTDLGKPVRALSTGQKRKLQIAILIAQQANVLLLDEPTNHISLDVLEEFEAALLDFPGPVLAISHDRRFIKRFADEVWALHDGRLRKYLGGWEEYRAAVQSIALQP